ncbi:hypothetical protein COX99_02385 [Candidatus Pacearchaeota archaeon CG_4_10_14_0_2_um_filter_31_10]|nr:MAG: hypothetical protein COX99_02385 [Candidatus Pacearchaeota archaeon CG_4_10_14_0_2_um_filter_31_10]
MINVWNVFALIYSVFIFAYLFILFFLIAFRRKEYKKPYLKPFSIIIPCYNEDSKYLNLCLNSIINANGNKKIILVDDGSTKKETLDTLKRYENKITIIHKENGGKISAQVEGLKYVNTEIVIFTDSDTIMSKNALLELLKPFNNPNIGGVSGNVKLANRNQTFLTRIISSMYNWSFNTKRHATGGIGVMYVCPGALAAFRTILIQKLLPDYTNQMFLGKKAGDISDDAYLTLKVQFKFKKKIAFQKNAVVYTFSPFKLKTFLKQLIRWQKGVYKEILQSSRDNKKGNRLLFFDMWYGLFTSLIIKFIVLFFIIYLTITNIQYLLIYITITGFWIIGVGALYNLYTLFEDKKDFFYSFLWTVGYETIFWITTIPALLGIRNQTTWGTR